MSGQTTGPAIGQQHAATPRAGRARLLTTWWSVQELVDTRALVSSRSDDAGRTSTAVLGGGYALVALVLLAVGPPATPSLLAAGAVLIVLYAVAYRTEFVAAAGSAVPTQPVLVGMLLALPLHIVPFAVLCGLLLGGFGGFGGFGGWRGLGFGAACVQALNGWHCLGPVAVLALAGHPQARLAHWPVYLLALVAQMAIDALVAAVRAFTHGLTLLHLAGPLSWTFAVDAMLAPIGLCIVVAGDAAVPALALLAVPIGLMRLLARDRVTHLEAAVSLNEQARGDALTGLANRRAWDEALATATRRVRDDPRLQASVLVADLDGLKQVNDTAGHEAGDGLIRAMAEVLRAAVPDAVIVARLGGDEYGVLLVGAPASVSASAATSAQDGVGVAAAARIRSAMQAHPGVAGFVLSASLGLAHCPPAGTTEAAARAADDQASADKRERRAGRR